MKSVKSQLLVLFLFFLPPLFAQYFEFGWSDKLSYSNNKDGFFSGYINTNSTYMYALNSNYAVSPLNKNSKLKIVAYDKSTMKEVESVAIKGYQENGASKMEYETLDYHKTVVLEDRILVFWTRLTNTDSTKTEELYVESFKSDLERDKTIKKIYTTTQKVDVRQSQFAPSSLVVVSSKEANKVIVGSEFCKDGKNVSFRYLVLSNQLTASAEHEILLPSKCEAQYNGITSVYDCGKDGNIYIRTNVVLTREELKKIRPNETKSYLALTMVNPLSREAVTVDLKGENKTITDYNYVVTDTKTKIFGFFGDLTKDPSGIDKQGIFYTEIDNDTLVNATLNYAYFEKTTLKKLFPKSKTVRKKLKEVPLTEEELNTRFDIENIFAMEDGGFVLFFTRKYNYTEITSKSGGNGKNVYKTDYYCEKNNVSAIRITDKGQILWTSNIDRSITYPGTDIPDLQVIYKLNKFYVIYGIENEIKGAPKKKKKKPAYTDNIDYAVFDPSTGRPKKINLPINEKDVLKKDWRVVDPETIHVYDGSFYFHKMIVKQKPVWYVANILVFPSIYYSVLSGNTKHASGDLGVLRLMDGKPNKKQKAKK